MHSRAQWKWIPLAVAALLAAGCNGDGGAGAGTATPTLPVIAGSPTATPTAEVAEPTATPTAVAGAVVSGLVVVQQDVQAGADDALGAPPEGFGPAADETHFDRALSYADWTLSGPAALSGTTGPDGRFAIPDLAPGRYELELTKVLNGNLIAAAVPLVVGDDGTADLLVEIAQGAVRSVATYPQAGTEVEEITGANGSRAVLADGQLVAVGDSGQTLEDPDADGLFLPSRCYDHLWLCDDARGCGPDRLCQCSASCSLCEDCGPGVCVPPGSASPYRCNSDGSCALSGDTCACVSTCEACDDCALELCIPACAPIEIVDLDVTGPAQLRVGRRGSMRAFAVLDSGGRIDVTHLAHWQSTDENVATVDSWGTVVARQPGTASITATLGDLTSAPWEIEVMARPPPRRIIVQNTSCFYPLGVPERGGPVPDPTFAPFPADIFPVPPCLQVVRIGGHIQFAAYGEFADGSFEDLTGEVAWEVAPPEIGDVVRGLFTGRQEGTAQLRASLGNVVSDPTEIRVVSEPTVVWLSISAINGPVPPIFVASEGPATDAAMPCFDCGYQLTVLRGDEIRFRATAQYDTGEWEDVTGRVSWRSSDPATASIDAAGAMTAVEAGGAVIDAVLEEVTSNQVEVRVVDHATLIRLSIFQDGRDRVVAKGEQAFFRATASYDVGFDRDVTEVAVWRSSDESVGGFDAPGVFTGRAAGTVEVWAELDDAASNRLPFEVFETSAIDHCDPDNINRGEWSDAFNRVTLESDCALYTPPEVATFRFTVTERNRPAGIFDPCLDLFVFRNGQKLRTIREEGCGTPFLAPGSPERDAAAPRYQLLAFWDLKDERGNLVPPGRYTIYGRFYLYFDPVVSVDVMVTGPNGRIPCVDNECGNGCGYVHACGDVDPPVTCPEVCVPLCECPPGWGITTDGDCEACTDGCCPPGELCAPGVPPCAPPPCCNPGDVCGPEQPPCEPCCPPGADCGPRPLPPCEPPPCCPANARCTPDVPPCNEPLCCHPGETCPDDLPACPASTGGG